MKAVLVFTSLQAKVFELNFSIRKISWRWSNQAIKIILVAGQFAQCPVLKCWKALSKQEMFVDQTGSNIVWWPNILMLYWVAKRYQTCLSKQNVLQCLIKCLNSNVQILSNTIKHDQTRRPNGKMFGHQTMFDCVWLPNNSRLDRAEETKCKLI